MPSVRMLNEEQGQLYLPLPPTSAGPLEGTSVDMCHHLNVRALFSLHTNYAAFPCFV